MGRATAAAVAFEADGLTVAARLPEVCGGGFVAGLAPMVEGGRMGRATAAELADEAAGLTVAGRLPEACGGGFAAGINMTCLQSEQRPILPAALSGALFFFPHCWQSTMMGTEPFPAQDTIETNNIFHCWNIIVSS